MNLDELNTNSTIFNGKMDDICWGRSLALTKKKYLVLAPTETMEGDAVCMIGRCSMPIILREITDGVFQVVGACYA